MGYSGVWDNLVRWYTLCIDGNITYNPVSRWWCDSHGVGFRVAHTQFDIRGAQQEHWTLWEQDAQKRGRGFVAQVDQQPIANRPRLLADLSRSEPGAGTTLQRLCPTYPNSTEQQISRWLDPRWIDCYMAALKTTTTMWSDASHPTRILRTRHIQRGTGRLIFQSIMGFPAVEPALSYTAPEPGWLSNHHSRWNMYLQKIAISWGFLGCSLRRLGLRLTYVRGSRPNVTRIRCNSLDM